MRKRPKPKKETNSFLTTPFNYSVSKKLKTFSILTGSETQIIRNGRFFTFRQGHKTNPKDKTINRKPIPPPQRKINQSQPTTP